jgi:acyl carrier protein
MTTASHPAGLATSRIPAADVLADLTAVLAGVMGVDAQALDAERPFPLLGLDSLPGVEFLGALGARYGITLGQSTLLDHPTPAALARHVAALLGAPGEVPSAPARPLGGGASPDTEVLEALRTQLATILRCAPSELDDRAPFTMLGLDSILAAEFVAGINRTWGLAEQAAVLYDHPDLAAMAAWVTDRRTGTPAAAGLDLNALLDAVRDDVLSVDEAAALLAARSA